MDPTPSNHSYGIPVAPIRRARNRIARVGIVGSVAAACLLTWIGVRGALQKRAIDAILKYDASVYALYGEYHRRWFIRVDRPSDLPVILWTAPQKRLRGYWVEDLPPKSIAWAVPMLGQRFATHVVEIVVHDRQFTDAEVDRLLVFPDVKVLDLAGTSITDAGLTKLASLEQLVELNLSHTQVTGRSTRLLDRCRDLQSLDLSGTEDSEVVAAELGRQLPHCSIIK